jgi:hypothetical protein
MRSLITLTIVFLIAAGTAFAQVDQQKQAEVKKSYLYKWIDDKGVAHVTDNLGMVPKQYREKVLVIEQPQRTEEPAARQPQLSPPSSSEDDQWLEEDRKASWQERMRDARKRLADAKQRYRALDRKRIEALEKWGGSAASGHLEGRAEADRIEQEMKQVQREIDDARNQIENVIPEEGRKAGIPPGWLRE